MKHRTQTAVTHALTEKAGDPAATKTNKTNPAKRTTVHGFFPSLRQIRAFASVATLESISRASAELNLSQSAVTQAIANLETDLDAQLFERRNKGSYLTDIGQILKRRTERFFQEVEDTLGEFIDGGKDETALDMLSRRLTRAQILALIAIRETGSFTQAALYAGVSQPSIHRSARTLETHLHCKIFQGTAHGATINETGRRLADRLHLAIRQFEWAHEEVEAEKGIVQGRILVGGMMHAGSGFLASALSKFTAAYPDVNVDVINAPYDVLLDRLRAGALDFVVGLLKNPPPADDVSEEVLAADPYVIAVRRDHPLARRTKITREELAAFDWVVPGVTAARRATYDLIFEGLPQPRANIETFSLTTILLLLADSDRMTILTESQLRLDRRLGHNLTKLNYEPTGPDAFIGVTTRRDWLPTPLQSAFLEYLRRAGKDDDNAMVAAPVLLKAS